MGIAAVLRLRRTEDRCAPQRSGMIASVEWKRRHVGPGGFLYDGALLIGQVAEYSRTDRPGTTNVISHFYVGFIRGHRVTCECATYDEACRNVERAAASL